MNGHNVLNTIGNGFNMTSMLQNSTNGKNGGQRVMQIIPMILSML